MCQVRGVSYYTGLVFEIYVDTDEGPLQLCGGGRYDDLARGLGAREPVPACGFSYGLERVDLALGPAQATGARIITLTLDGTDFPTGLHRLQVTQLIIYLAPAGDSVPPTKVTLQHAGRGGS